ncbi:STAS/SEC14 domain-containing protein [Mycolicibacterium pulveris]|uniref:STAS/SEC14 domain-containing protein n=1 Tax=Mycolicibacterium pulveris TaxID=36813 RepID=UPI003CF85198
MIEFEPTDAADVLIVHARGRLTRTDYRDVLAPRVRSMLEQTGTLRVMFLVDDTFRGWTLGAAWENTLLDLRHRRDFEKVAMVGAPKWEEWCVKLAAALLMKGQLKTFPLDERAQAWKWLCA